MSFNIKETEVLIAGGGPSGAATALSLAARGIKCIVAEATAGPRTKAGETIPPNALPLFKRLGICNLLEDPAHLYSLGNRYAWGNSTYEDKTFLATPFQHGWHIDRSSFEGQLSNHIAGRGAELMAGWRVNACSEHNRGMTVTLNNDTGDTTRIECQFIVDATGRPSRIARMMGVQRTSMDKLSGISVCMNVADINCPLYTFIEAQPGGWWYAAPLSGLRLVLTFMTDTDLLDKEMLLNNHFFERAKQTTLIKELLIDMTITGCSEPAVYTAATSCLVQRYGPSWLAVGDAACSYDPLSSYGIISALESGFYAGHAIADKLGGKEEAMDSYDWLLSQAFSTYLEMHSHQYQLEKRWPEETFWKRRLTADKFAV